MTICSMFHPPKMKLKQITKQYVNIYFQILFDVVYMVHFCSKCSTGIHFVPLVVEAPCTFTIQCVVIDVVMSCMLLRKNTV